MNPKPLVLYPDLTDVCGPQMHQKYTKIGISNVFDATAIFPRPNWSGLIPMRFLCVKRKSVTAYIMIQIQHSGLVLMYF